MTEKQQIVQEIMTYPVDYAAFRAVMTKDLQWDEKRLEFMELYNLKDYLRDIKTFERNKQKIRDENN